MKKLIGMLAMLYLCVLTVGVSQATIITFQDGLNGFAGTEDNYLVFGGTGSINRYNFGAATTNYAGEYIGYNASRPMYRFNIAGLLPSLPSGQSYVFNSAKLVLTVGYFSPTANGNFDLSIHEVKAANASWVEGTKTGTAIDPLGPNWSYKQDNPTLNWAGYNAADGWVKGCGKIGTDIEAAMATVQANSANAGDGKQMEFAINTALVQQWLSGGTNAGVLIKSNIEGSTTDYYRGFYSSETASINAAKRPQLVIDYTVVVPEPATVAILGLGGLAAFARRKQNRS